MAMITRSEPQYLVPVTVNQIPILFGFKSFSNTEAVSTVHLDLTRIRRDAHGNEDEPRADESDRSFEIYSFHEVIGAEENPLQSLCLRQESKSSTILILLPLFLSVLPWERPKPVSVRCLFNSAGYSSN